ncbi:MAG: NADH:ubiquinone oxidoreductase [Nitrospirae bacterium CG_4_9_14_3_um_filter_53_35]|nr:MAG: NADH:ubiquinone oxidoreductase [Nitrospirae bacterium CG2_30_53_67]PIS37954.1 MAG: NADH:ubiquinone oxidoreductase [Nitrospirae bacterium CG08_land_8_20_14_0_20_52_24]PIV82584.1 MAG: NADH:ubiquinone oxidoreductase [Nitrospirae bacterium CG17_big_fil_post_rev_8_21_14_2_50_50_9]PIW84490.1 MAG: NADH:ubiquinone oxidoreductase [Nitrospirae bacterium CG_4_8_14_3_um_filter_50_41]PIX85120.1 MAG: NADH:ubiquinone oxidoreductase [Nitrospirae bacterium CG_4_10_14_3_um_filter_53_41]PJA77409.1 MAG: N
MKYLGIETAKPKIGVFDFTGCEGCELQLLNKEETLPDFLSLIEVVNFREASSDQSDDYDIAFVEGSISREDEITRLKQIRANAGVLVALGSCACFGGVNKIRERFDISDVVREVYGNHEVETGEVKSVKEVVPVDLEIPGCPVSKTEVEKIVIALVTGSEIRIPKYPVCVECRQKMNICMFDFGTICLGPLTLAGCGAVCIAGKVGCRGCRGPAEDANYDSFMETMLKKGYPRSEIEDKIAFFNGLDGIRTGHVVSPIQERVHSFNAKRGV